MVGPVHGTAQPPFVVCPAVNQPNPRLQITPGVESPPEQPGFATEDPGSGYERGATTPRARPHPIVVDWRVVIHPQIHSEAPAYWA